MALDLVVTITMSLVVIGKRGMSSVGRGGASLADMRCRLIDTPISTPMSRWEKYRTSRTSWGINVLGSFCVEIEGSDGTVGFATGFGGMSKMTLKT